MISYGGYWIFSFLKCAQVSQIGMGANLPQNASKTNIISHQTLFARVGHEIMDFHLTIFTAIEYTVHLFIPSPLHLLGILQ